MQEASKETPMRLRACLKTTEHQSLHTKAEWRLGAQRIGQKIAPYMLDVYLDKHMELSAFGVWAGMFLI